MDEIADLQTSQWDGEARGRSAQGPCISLGSEREYKELAVMTYGG